MSEGNGLVTAQVNPVVRYSREQIELLKRTVCRGASDDEFQLFAHICQRTGLDPFARQIYAIKRREQDESGNYVERMTTQTGIDGYRLVAERTGCYCPGREPAYEHDAEGRLVKATAYVMKFVGGVWHEIAASAYYAEYVQTKRNGDPTRFWFRMPHVMLAKCAEALVLRKAFPMLLAGVYTAEEMEQADDEPAALPEVQPAQKGKALPAPVAEVKASYARMTPEQNRELETLLAERDASPVKLCNYYGVDHVSGIPAHEFERVKKQLLGKPLKAKEVPAAEVKAEPAPVAAEPAAEVKAEPAPVAAEQPAEVKAEPVSDSIAF